MRTILTLAAGSALLAGCGSGHGQALQVVASTNVYGDIARQIAGADAQVTSILSDPNADPHLFEAGTANGLAVARAKVVIANGTAQHALLGVTPTNASNGVGVSSVETGSAADNAGLKVGDVITAVNGKAVTTPAQLRAVIAAHQPGDKLALTVRRDGSSKAITATLGSRS